MDFIDFKLLHWPFSLSDLVHHLEDELESAKTELTTTRGRYERVQEHPAKLLAEVTTLTGDLEEANLTITRHVLRNKDLSNRFSALRRQIDTTALQKDVEHVSTQTDPLPSLVTSPSLAAGRKPPTAPVTALVSLQRRHRGAFHYTG